MAIPIQDQSVTIETLLELLAQYGGKIVSTASLSPEWINQAMASGRLYVDKNSLGYVWEPEIMTLPTNEKELEFFERWYPLEVEVPEHLKSMNWFENYKKRIDPKNN